MESVKKLVDENRLLVNMVKPTLLQRLKDEDGEPTGESISKLMSFNNTEI